MTTYPNRDHAFNCPRRLDTLAFALAIANRNFPADVFTTECEKGFEGGQDKWRHDGTCSYCGSMNPADFMEKVKAGVEIGPTDKNYKVYVDQHGGKFYVAHLTRSQAEEFWQLYLAGKVHVGYPGYFYNGIYLHPATNVESEA